MMWLVSLLKEKETPEFPFCHVSMQEEDSHL